MRDIENRKYIITLLFILVAMIFVGRLFYMQVVDDKWKERAAEISENKVVTYPARGIVYDRNKEKIIANEVYYDIRVIPSQAKNTDSVALVKLLDIPMEEYVDKMNKARDYSYIKSSELVRQIPPNEFAEIAPQMYKFPGFFEVARTLRMYPKNTAAHVLGYMNEVSPTDIERMPYYKAGDFIGREGIENKYEEVLRGKRGVKYLLQDAVGVTSGTYEDGRFDTLALQGKNITISLDWELQEYGEKLMQNKLGSIVAIEPKSGEILAMVSAPTYDPNLLVGRRLGENYYNLQEDTLLPLQNRATLSKYPPGSIFKTIMALIGMQEGVITENSSFACQKSLVGCHNHPTAGGVSDAVKMSCNPYFYQVGRRIIQQGKKKSHFADAAIGTDIWADYVKSFGIGTDLHTDFPGVIRGHVPTTEYYNSVYHEYGWAFSTIYSISIGQGEVEVTPLEMANLACIMANRGYYYYPHFIKEIEGGYIPDIYTQRNYTKVDKKYFEPVIDGMWRVVHEPGGTARRARVDSLNICGKTGTAENFKMVNGRREQLVDHSVFMAFAPQDDPQIAIAVYVENSGFGGTWAAPIASLMMENYITGTISDTVKENRILNAVLIKDDVSNIVKPKK
ncbi:MAG: penicillin-binding protein 2 [Flavobacteriales bacterium]|nr:penicillin-binding protein 2 [Flavobacteriales bacterium]